MAADRHEDERATEATLGAHEAELLRGGSRRRGRTDSDEVQLHVCAECASELVYPTDWAPAAPKHWHVELRCPECEWRGEGIYSQDIVDRFDIALDDGTEAVLDDLTRLTRANMEEEVDRFVDALARDLILPEDF
jgi:hypothetical protein